MLSDTIRNLARQFAAWGHDGGVRLERAACELAEAQLLHCAEQVATLEGAPVPPAHRGALRVIAGGRATDGAA